MVLIVIWGREGGGGVEASSGEGRGWIGWRNGVWGWGIMEGEYGLVLQTSVQLREKS